MIRGSVTEGKAVLVEFGIMDNDGRIWPIQAELDTGFTGDLSLPPSAIQRLCLPNLGPRSFALADGTRTLMNSYSGRVFWHEQPIEVVVVQSDGVPLIGMGLLWGSRVTLEAMSGGNVIIEELQPTQL